MSAETKTEYVVYLQAIATYAIAVEASSPEEAEKLAEEQGARGLCHSCAAIDLGDFEVESDLTEATS